MAKSQEKLSTIFLHNSIVVRCSTPKTSGIAGRGDRRPKSLIVCDLEHQRFAD